MGSCLAGETCVFSHDPAKLMSAISLAGAGASSPKAAKLQLADTNSFPGLEHCSYSGSRSSSFGAMTPPPGLRNLQRSESPRPRSRPGSRHQGRPATEVAPSLDDNEAFPSLGSALTPKQGKKQPSKRGLAIK